MPAVKPLIGMKAFDSQPLKGFTCHPLQASKPHLRDKSVLCRTPSHAAVVVAGFPECFLPSPDRKDRSGASLPLAHQACQASFLGAAQANLVCTLLTTARAGNKCIPYLPLFMNLENL